MSDCVILKGKKDRLIVQLDSNIDFASLKDKFSEKIKQAESFIGSAKIAIEFTNRKLTEVEENILINIINKETSIDIAFVFSEKSIFSELPISQLPFNSIKDVTDEGTTKFYKGTLRSGHNLEFDGNVVILGDVNPGAIIRSKGNVLVLGYLNGTVYAGEDDGTEAFVGAFSLNPIQIKIGQIIAKNPSSNILDANKVKKTTDFEIAFLKNGNIFIEKFNKTTLEHMVKI
ncbi:septum site-determining protein MinC [Cetobacterium sp. 8H]|uniref:septum site-determining protein MinC n=1 Tax=Cetobacterium sp. 8H TaxID=2759681 RepID=UPI00163BC018|nr:septum site-determining protein MinC [Cetobacterium sp. 8H]MBC2850032.1 septum site-determining protein MinC [Cetobacterium sp. 8H]